MKSEVRIGISGWNYAGRRGAFYPKGLPYRRELEFASRAFNSIEIKRIFLFAATTNELSAPVRGNAGKWPYAEDLTANFVYCRLHGDTQLYSSGYSHRALDWWVTRLKLWRKG